MEAKSINWKSYNRELINRGSVTLWIEEENTENWYSNIPSVNKGRPFIYSVLAIELLCILGYRFGLALRGLQGFSESIFSLMGLELKIPNYSTISRRMTKMDIKILDKIKKSEPLNIAIDSSGLKVYGEGEWKVKIHGRQKHRTWRKIHLAIDCKTNKIIKAALTTNNLKDSEVFEDMINNNCEISSVFADGAYESNNCYEQAERKGIKPIIPPRRNAKISKRNSQKPRDKVIREINAKGRKKWKQESGYHQRSLSETAFSRMKIMMGDKLKSRKFENQVSEAFIKCKILNRMKTPKEF